MASGPEAPRACLIRELLTEGGSGESREGGLRESRRAERQFQVVSYWVGHQQEGVLDSSVNNLQ